jgi:hypothetical protein
LVGSFGDFEYTGLVVVSPARAKDIANYGAAVKTICSGKIVCDGLAMDQ